MSTILIAPLIETARGVTELEEIAGAERVSHVMYGQADLGAELGLAPGDDEREWDPLRFQLSVASAAADIHPPIGPAWTHLADEAGLLTSSATLRRFGFVGRTAIHPAQLPIIHSAFAPTTEEITWATAILDAFSAAEGSSTGVALSSDGEFVDRAVVRRAQAIVANTQDSL